MGIWPDILVCRSDYPVDENMREKIALFCNVPKENVLQNLDAQSLYEVPLMLEEEHLAAAVCKCLNIPCPEPDLEKWKQMVEDFHNPTRSVTIAIVGKYVALHDAYLSVVEALRIKQRLTFAGLMRRSCFRIIWRSICMMCREFWFPEALVRGEPKEKFWRRNMPERRKSLILEFAWECSWQLWNLPEMYVS